MDSLVNKIILSNLKDSQNLIKDIIADKKLIKSINMSIKKCINCLANDNKILLIGNGGSAADAQHIAAEFVSRFKFNRSPLPAIALTTDTSNLTAIGNDYGFEKIFERQLDAIANEGDLLIAYSTSGNSENILNAIKYCNCNNIEVIGMTGNTYSQMSSICKLNVAVPSSSTASIQEAHAIIGHIFCDAVEQYFFAK